jgi:hypothetical protein
VTDLAALLANEVETVDAFVDLFPVEHAPAQLLDPNAEQLFVIFLDFTPSGFVAWKIFVFGFIVTAVIDVIVRAILGGSTSAFFLGPGHEFRCSVD